MFQNRLTFNSSTNIKIPTGIYDVLFFDAYTFGFTKNDRPNVNGFLNHLIPILSSYQDDLHNKLLQYNNGNTELTKTIEQNIFNVYLAPFTFSDDSQTNLPFRINKEHYDDFITIHDVKLEHYKTDFTNYIRNLLIEYAIKATNQREYIFSYPLISIIKNAITNQQLCHFYCTDEKLSFVPVSIEVSPVTRHNLVVGITPTDYKKVEFTRLCSIKKIIVDSLVLDLTDDDYTNVCDTLLAYFSGEKAGCSE